VTKTNALESLVIAGFVRGLSVRDVEAALVAALDEAAAVSKSTVWRVFAEIAAQFEQWNCWQLDDAGKPMRSLQPLPPNQFARPSIGL